MSHLSIQLLGKLTIQVDGHRINGFDSRKNQELLTYLLVYRDRPHTRESLAEMLWQGSSTSQSKKYLRQALWQIQQLLPIARLILTEPDWIRISPEISYWLDVAEFERAYAQSEGVAGHHLIRRPLFIEVICWRGGIWIGVSTSANDCKLCGWPCSTN